MAAQAFDFSFLNSVQAVEIPTVERVLRAVPRNPTKGDIRLFKDGSVYPSKALVEKHNLEYTSKSTNEGNGFDIIDSRKWSQYRADIRQGVFITLVPKKLPKVDLFAQVRYNKDGEPGVSVMEQGANTAGKQLIDSLREIYDLGIEGETDKLFGERNFVDLQIQSDVVVFGTLPKYYVPKLLVKGAKAGQWSYERRESLSINPLIVLQQETIEEVKTVEEAVSTTTSLV